MPASPDGTAGGREASPAPFEAHVIRLMQAVHPLERIPRAGYVLRGVTEPESVAAHSHGVALLTLLFCDRYEEAFDKGKALALALIHDLAEARLMDIPMPAAQAHLKEAKAEAEQAVLEDLAAGFDAPYGALHRELHEARTPEACLVRGLDKAQMMLKVAAYQEEGRGRLDEFWQHPANFNDFGLACVRQLFDQLCTEAGRTRPAGA